LRPPTLHPAAGLPSEATTGVETNSAPASTMGDAGSTAATVADADAETIPAVLEMQAAPTGEEVVANVCGDIVPAAPVTLDQNQDPEKTGDGTAKDATASTAKAAGDSHGDEDQELGEEEQKTDDEIWVGRLGSALDADAEGDVTDNATQFYTPSADAGMDQDNGAGDDAPDRQDYLDASPQPGNPWYFMRKTCKAGYFTYFELLDTFGIPFEYEPYDS